MDIANDEEIIECYERLREMYIAGGYTPTLDESRENNSVADGLSDNDEKDGDLSQMECV